MPRSSSFQFGFDIVMEKGPCPRPVAIRVWNKPEQFKQAEFNPPFKYMADALTGLSLVRLNPEVNAHVPAKFKDSHFCEKAWSTLDPHYALWSRSRDRVKSLQQEITQVSPKTCAEFEELFDKTLDAAFRPEGINLKELDGLVDLISRLESQKKHPLLYNFGLNFSEKFNQRMHSLYSLLFHLRSVVAVDWNAHVEDASHEAVKVDSITDYLPKAEYVVHDALLYWHFSKLSHEFTQGKNSDVRIEKVFVEPLRKAFKTESHNACHLIDQLPKNFLEGLSHGELEEALYLVQMDWLLGSEAGLLFRIREELYGLQNGYEKIFWQELEGAPAKKSFHLSLCFELPEKGFTTPQAA